MQKCIIIWRRFTPKPVRTLQGEALKTRKLGAIGVVAALAMAPAMPAQAAFTGANGSLSCPAGQVVWVFGTQQYSAQVKVSPGTALRYTYTAVNNYGTSSVNWRVEATRNLQTVGDKCRSDYNLVSPEGPPSE
ncbi:hypothetical protein AB4Y86_13195 [Arthrobacter sp. 2YAF22_2]|uniref:hypothetical protein n=1 Tax=Arthrobacter sp. 2YAF22_2 TaxID=3233029 RepID=UPI003F8F8882